MEMLKSQNLPHPKIKKQFVWISTVLQLLL